MNLETFLRWLLSDGLPIVVSFVLTTVIPDLLGDNFENLIPPRWRRLTVLGIAVVISALALAVARALLGWAIDQNLIWSVLVSVFAVYTGQSLVNSRKLPTTTRWRAFRVMWARGSANEIMEWKG